MFNVYSSIQVCSEETIKVIFLQLKSLNVGLSPQLVNEYGSMCSITTKINSLHILLHLN